ncbi:hypothetical protein NL473_29470, partial [Klebsiella pneumoniae]|nr:hypothetical protein [Klebsiella pneumoniae]MCP6594756.1 hypothetical protein [Klebsiella pneumoniae]
KDTVCLLVLALEGKTTHQMGGFNPGYQGTGLPTTVSQVFRWLKPPLVSVFGLGRSERYL